MSLSERKLTVVDFYGEQNNYKCGYCKQIDTCQSHGMWAHSMRAQDYQQLIDRGWRRSGQYCYKPNMPVTCCPSYTIKCDVTNFNLTKSQKKTIKKFNKFLTDGIKDKCTSTIHSDTGSSPEDSISNTQHYENCEPKIELNERNLSYVMQQSSNSMLELTPSRTCQMEFQSESKAKEKIEDAKMSLDQVTAVQKKAKILRRERKAEKLAKMNKTPIDNTTKKTSKNVEKNLEMLLNEIPENSRHKLKVKLVPSSISTTNELDVYKEYQVNIHRDDRSKITKKSFENFLIRSPLKHETAPDGPTTGYGSFHQQYWLDDKLIAVGVIDILPYCVSSVYFFYDPEFSFLSLGTYGCLREIQLVKDLSRDTPALSNYYMGFYIQSCQKMRYKGKLHPSYLLCPETYTWHLLNESISSRLNLKKYHRLNIDQSVEDVDLFEESYLDSIRLLYNCNSQITYREYVQRVYFGLDKESFLVYGKLVGKTLSQRMLLCKP